MLNRLTELKDDQVAGMRAEIDRIIDAIERSVVDHKDGCEVLFAMRLDILKNIECDNSDPNNLSASYDDTDETEFREYFNIFDSFQYDIGHGKGTGEGPTYGSVGDYEVGVGANTYGWGL